jgi:hypothetical protein
VENSRVVTFPLWFKIFLAWFLLAIILGIVKYFARNKCALKVVQLSKEKRATILKSHLMIIKIYKGSS